MDSLDYFIVALGVALIVIGLYLFVAGKRDSANGNQVEGFGIKLNVSNPSIILIVFGIGLVLVPRLLPQNKHDQMIQLPATANNTNTPTVNVPSNNNSEESNVFFPQGVWFITQYEENGRNLSNSIQGNISFEPSNNGSLEWLANLDVVDTWGKVINYQYSGTINTVLGGYNINVLNSNDPSFSREGATPLIMKMDNSNSLHMEYRFNGSAIILHWSK
ncbi:hypothetical protein [Paraglaciecola sp. L3A3]|uniref:hypothetical protein n=1 Tax=Paraglaciecola sp. L3A3 TaxID=2686358 RepID=UPI00131D5550|nr:hypothetical protein [Paraglaciecola sp. L3A3]